MISEGLFHISTVLEHALFRNKVLGSLLCFRNFTIKRAQNSKCRTVLESSGSKLFRTVRIFVLRQLSTEIFIVKQPKANKIAVPNLVANAGSFMVKISALTCLSRKILMFLES